jgi:hypothetical protein
MFDQFRTAAVCILHHALLHIDSLYAFIIPFSSIPVMSGLFQSDWSHPPWFLHTQLLAHQWFIKMSIGFEVVQMYVIYQWLYSVKVSRLAMPCGESSSWPVESVSTIC